VPGSCATLRRATPTTKIAAGRRVHVDTVRYWREYDRGDALANLAAYDVHRARVFSHCSPKTGIVPFTTLVEKVMIQHPCASAKPFLGFDQPPVTHNGASLERSRW
jgi:hypothetical protein